MRPTFDCPAAREPMTGFGERSSCSERPQMGRRYGAARWVLPPNSERPDHRAIAATTHGSTVGKTQK